MGLVFLAFCFENILLFMKTVLSCMEFMQDILFLRPLKLKSGEKECVKSCLRTFKLEKRKKDREIHLFFI